MRPLIHPDFEDRLAYLENKIARYGRGRISFIPEAKDHLRRLWDYMIHSPFSRASGLDNQDTFMLLRKRIESAHTTEDVRDIIREFKQYSIAASSFARAQDIEERLHDLEGQIKPNPQAESTEPAKPEEVVVTLETLKKKKVLFTVMPFHDDFHDVWMGGIQRAATGSGLTPIRIDMITKSSDITDDIVSTIKLSELVVVDVTGNNPNVMFEFGFALALKKPHVVISQSTEFLTFDIKNVRTVIYKNTWKGIEDLHKDLQKCIKGGIGDKPKKK